MTDETRPSREAPDLSPAEAFPMPDRQKRMIRRTYVIAAILLIVSTLDSASQYRTYGAWQILADVV